MSREEFVKSLNSIGIDISENQEKALIRYYELLIEWNEKINLTSIVNKEEVYLKHFYDSLTLCMVHDFNNTISLCDIGTGAGFPGLVLKILFPKLKVTLVDSLNKRIIFLDEVIKELGLKDIQTFHERAEDFAKHNRDKYDVVTSRAVARLNILNELCLPLVKINGYFIAMKGNAKEEIEEIRKKLNILNSELELVKEFNLPIENSIRTLIKIKRVGNINKMYPRKFEKIKEKPL